MKIKLTLTIDDWQRALLSTAFHTPEPAHVLIFVEHEKEMWWSKSYIATTDHVYSALYHHVNLDDKQRQVIVSCGASIQNCIIPAGFDPCESLDANIEPFVPSIIYSNKLHRLGLILVPKSATKSLRNKIWRIKDEFNSAALSRYADALVHGRNGHAEVGKDGGV